jgi:hypothetical protein
MNGKVFGKYNEHDKGTPIDVGDRSVEVHSSLINEQLRFSINLFHVFVRI